MHPNGPPRLHINPPYYQQQQMAPTSAPYFSSPATYSPLPFTQQSFNSGENGGRGFFPAGRSDGMSAGYSGLPIIGAPMMGLGLSQMSEAPSMLRSSSSSSYSSTSSFVPSTPNNFGSYFSPPLQQSSPALFSPPLPASPSFSSNSIRPIPHRTKLHAHAPSFHDPNNSSPPTRRTNKNLSISVRGGNPFPQRHGRNESTFKATTPLGVGTRPDEEVKKKKKILVRIPKEREKKEETEAEDDRKQSRFSRIPLGRDDKLRKMEEMERDLEDGTVMLEEDEIVGKSCHYEEQKSPSLPSTIEVYLPGLAGWEIAWEEFGEDSYARSGCFDVPKPAFLDPISPILSRSGLSSPTASFSASSPLNSAPIPPPSSQRSHTRTFSLFDSPVALPARLQNVLDNLSGRRASHGSSMSLSSTKDQLNPAATPFSTSKSSSQSKLTSFAPAFTLPSWAAIKAKAQGIPLPDTDDSMEEGIEGEDSSSHNPGESAHELVESSVAIKEGPLAQNEVDGAGQAVVEGLTEEAKDKEGPSRKLSGVSTITDHTGTASVSDGFSEEEGGGSEDRDILVESPQASNADLHDSSPHRPTSSLGDEMIRAMSDLGPLETNADPSLDKASIQLLSVNTPSVPKEEASEGEHKFNKSFEFPLRSPVVSPVKPRPLQLLPSESYQSTPLEPASVLSPNLPTSLTFRQAEEDSLQNSPTLFTANGAPGPLATSSRDDSPSPSSLQNPHPSLSSDDLTTDDLEPLQALRPLLDRNGGNEDTNVKALLPSFPLVRPTPRRPHLDFMRDSSLPSSSASPLPFSNSDKLSSTSFAHSFDFHLPGHAPQLPSYLQNESPRKVSHGPLPPIPLLAVTSSHDGRTKKQKVETAQLGIGAAGTASLSRAVSTPNISARRPLPTPPSDCRPRTPSNYRASYDFGSLSLATLDDAIPEQYSPRRSNPPSSSDRPFQLRTMASFSSDGRILGFNGGSSTKVRSPLPTFSTPGSSIDAGSSTQRGRRESTDINLPTTSRSKSRAIAISTENVDAVEERHSSDTDGSIQSSRDSSVVELSEDGLLEDDEDDMPLRILEGIIERQFDGLRAELQAAASTLQQDTLVEAVAKRLEDLLLSSKLGRDVASSLSTEEELGIPPLHNTLRSSTPALEFNPAASYSVFLDDLRATVLPLVQAPLDTNTLESKLTNQLQQELARHSEEMLKMVSARLEDTARDALSSSALGDLKQVATVQENIAEAVKDLGSNFAQLAQDVNLSQAASSNLKNTVGQLSLDVTSRLDSAYSALDTLLHEHLAKLPSPDHDLEAQLAKARNEKAVLEERLSRLVDDAAHLRSDLVHAQKAIKELEEEKLESIAESARLEADFANSQDNLRDLKQVLVSRDERLETVLDEKHKLSVDFGEAKSQIESLSIERDRLSQEKDILAHQNQSLSRTSPPTFDRARLDSTESDPNLSPPPPSQPAASKLPSSSRPSTPTKLVPQLTGGSDDSDDTIAHTDVSPPSVLGRNFALSDDGWYTEA